MGLRETLTLKETLEAATPGRWEALDAEGIERNVVPWVGVTTETGGILSIADDIGTPDDAHLIALAPELAARNIEATEKLRDLRSAYGHLMHVDELADLDALLARLDQIGVADETQLGKEQT